jgi:hypothetical protein
MKKLAIILALLMSAPYAFGADNAVKAVEKVNYYTPYYNQGNIVQGRTVQHAPQNSKVYKESSGNKYILKYNVDDLESAPWLNGGKRKYN